MNDDSKVILGISAVLSVCGYAAIIYFLYTKVLVFAGGFVIGLIILTPLLSYMIAKFLIWSLGADMW